MALFSLTVNGCRPGDYKGRASDTAVTTLQKVCTFYQGLSGHSYVADSFSVSDDAATGTVTLSNVGGTASQGSVTYSSASGTTAVTVGAAPGVVFSQTTGTDSARATALAAAITASVNPLVAGVVTANASLGVVNITAVHKGAAGDDIILDASGTGVSVSPGATLGGGADGSVDVVIASNTVTTDTTDLTNAQAATAIASAINNDGGDGTSGYASTFVTASATAAVVTLTAKVGGQFGNIVSLSTSTATGTASRSGALLTGGTATTYNL